MKKKTIALLLALALVFGGAVGGTIAWLTATSDTVTNTFTVGDINITLSETTGSSYKMVPGSDIAKDPKVTVEADSEACYLFVKITEENNTMTVNGKDEKIVSYTIADGWTEVTGHEGYYYRTVSAADATAGTSYYVFAGEGTGDLKNGYVTINENVTKGQITTENQPKIIITAAAVQSENVADVDAAWDKLPALFTGTAT